MEKSIDLIVLLKKLYSSEFDQKDYDMLTRYLGGMLSKIASRIQTKGEKSGTMIELISKFESQTSLETMQNIVSDFIAHLIKKRYRYESVLKNEPEKLNGYIARSLTNFLIDHYRRSVLRQLVKEDRDNPSEDELLKDIEAFQIKKLILNVLKGDELKYVCYKIDPKRYSCFWHGKSKEAMYQDVRRKGKEVLRRLGLAIDKAGITPDGFEIFAKKYLSEMCENLRLKICEGE